MIVMYPLYSYVVSRTFSFAHLIILEINIVIAAI